MKTLKLILSITFFTFLTKYSFAEKDSTIVIKTSAQCESCQKRIENGIMFEKGVQSAKLDLKTKAITIVFDQTKTTPDNLRKAVTKTGYDADSFPANEKAYGKLPKCCQKGGM